MKKCFFFFRQSDKALQETNINNCEILDSNPYKDVLLNNIDIVNLTGLMVETIFFFENEGWRQRLERCYHGNNNIEMDYTTFDESLTIVYMHSAIILWE